MSTELAEPDPFDVALGRRIRVMRKEQRITQASLATALGVSFQQVQKYERGTNRLSASSLAKVAQHLDSSVAALIGEADKLSRKGDTLELIALPGAVELLQAFASIDQGAYRTALLKFARVLSTPDE